MTHHREFLRLKSLGLTNRDIAAACACGRNTVTRMLARARENGLTWEKAHTMLQREVSLKLFPRETGVPTYKRPDYEHVHREMQKSGVTLSLLWVEYCEQCRQNGELPYKSTQFNKYYADFVHKTKSTMHLEHKPGETLQVDRAGQAAGLVDTDTGERIAACVFVAVLPYSGYAYVEAFLDMKHGSQLTSTPTASLAVLRESLLRTASRLASTETRGMKLSSPSHIRRCPSITALPSSLLGPDRQRIRLS